MPLNTFAIPTNSRQKRAAVSHTPSATFLESRLIAEHLIRNVAGFKRNTRDSQAKPSRNLSAAPLFVGSWEEILMTSTVQEARIPDSTLAREITELVRDTVSPLIFHHSSRVYHFGALAGKRRKLSFYPELL